MRPSKDILTFGITFALILLVIVGFIGKSIFFQEKPIDQSQQSATEDILKKYPSIPAEALRLKMSKNDPVEVIDIRPQPLYAQEHIPYSRNAIIGELDRYVPENKDALVIVLTLSDDVASIEQADAILKDKPFTYAFLDGGIASWKAVSGNLISIGDPDSVVDRSKVSFKTAEETNAILTGADKNLYVIIDTRSASAYSAGHIPTAINIPLDKLEQKRDSIPSGRQAIAYGSDDLESFQAAVRLYDLNVFSSSAIENGFASWLEKKYEVAK